jgi:hypothetical protein
MGNSGDARELLPQDKFDTAAVVRIRTAGYPAVAAILDALVDWTADGNWPVARPIAEFLITLGDPVVAPIARVLRGSDSTHKEHLLRMVVQRLPRDILMKLEPELQQLVQQPSESDQGEQVDLAAREALDRLKG